MSAMEAVIEEPAMQQGMDGGAGIPAARRTRQPGGAAKGAGPRANPLGRPGRQAPQLTGVAQVVGLALGSPEFQRR